MRIWHFTAATARRARRFDVGLAIRLSAEADDDALCLGADMERQCPSLVVDSDARRLAPRADGAVGLVPHSVDPVLVIEAGFAYGIGAIRRPLVELLAEPHDLLPDALHGADRGAALAAQR